MRREHAGPGAVSLCREPGVKVVDNLPKGNHCGASVGQTYLLPENLKIIGIY
jgi:hypothetical protein